MKNCEMNSCIFAFSGYRSLSSDKMGEKLLRIEEPWVGGTSSMC